MSRAVVDMQAQRRTRRPAKPEAVLLPYQRRWVTDDSNMKLWEKSRRIGADYCEAYKIAHSRISGQRPIDLWYSSNDESAAREFMDYVAWWSGLFDHVAKVVDDTLSISGADVHVFRIDFVGCGARGGRAVDPKVVALTSNPKAFRSKGGDVTLSEFAFHDDPRSMWKAAYPCTTWGGRMAILSSHHGELSHFNELVCGARRRIDPAQFGAARPSDVKFSLHRTSIYDAVDQGLVERINAVSGKTETREAFVARVRAECGDPIVWQEEYECVPSSDAGSYFPFDLLRPCVRSDAPKPTDNLATFLADVTRSSEGATALYAGCDVGRRRDLFVIDVVAKVGGMLRHAGTLRRSKPSFDEMEFAIDGLMRHDHGDDGRVRRLCIDETGLGMQLAERMKSRFGYRVEPVTFSGPVKNELATLVRRHMEEKTATLPDEPAYLAAFNAIRREVTVAGNVRFDADRSDAGHADEFWAKALALHAGEKTSRAYMVRAMGGAIA